MSFEMTPFGARIGDILVDYTVFADDRPFDLHRIARIGITHAANETTPTTVIVRIMAHTADHEMHASLREGGLARIRVRRKSDEAPLTELRVALIDYTEWVAADAAAPAVTFRDYRFAVR